LFLKDFLNSSKDGAKQSTKQITNAFAKNMFNLYMKKPGKKSVFICRTR